MGELVCSGPEKKICNCKASLQRTNIIKNFTARRLVHLGGFTEHWRLTLTHRAEMRVLLFLPRYCRLLSQNEGRSFHFG